MDVHVYVYRLEGGYIARRDDVPHALWLGQDTKEAVRCFEKLFQVPPAMIDWLKPGESVLIWLPEWIADPAFGVE